MFDYFRGVEMTVSYKRLWKTLIDHEWNKTRLCEETKMSASTMATIGKTPSDNRAGSNNVGMINKIML